MKPRITGVSLGEAGVLLAPFSRKLLALVPSTGLAASKSWEGGTRGVMPPSTAERYEVRGCGQAGASAGLEAARS